MDSNRINVLLIDDDPAYAKVASHLLNRFQARKFNLIWKQSGEEGIKELEANPHIHVVVMDYLLPGTNGVEIVKQLHERNVTVPVIMLTTQKNFQVAVDAMRHGVSDYLVKDEASDMVLPKAILGVLDHVQVKKQVAEIEKEQLLAQKRAEAIQELIVTICHEFNNPLAAIKISMDIISRQPLGAEERKLLEQLLENIGILEKEISRLRNVHWGMDEAKTK